MPIYEFKCAKCGNLSEVVQRVGARAPPCPVCGSRRMTRAVSRTAFHLKGGGWHADLYATPRPGSDQAEGAETARAKEAKPADGKPKDEKPVAGAAAGGAGEPAAPAAAPSATTPEAASKEGSRPPRRRSSAPPRTRR